MCSYAQTIHQLYLQLIHAGYSETDLLEIKAAYGLQCDLFAGMMTESGKPHISHGIGTASILAALDMPRHVVLAGMIHNAYGLGDFGDKVKGPTQQRRSEVGRIVGPQAEQCIERFYRMRPWTRDAIARISSQFETLDDAGRETVLIRLADDLEHHLDMGLVYRVNGVMLQQAKERRDVTVHLAEQLQFPHLAAQLRRVHAEYDAADVATALCKDPQAPRHLIPRSLR